MMKALQYALCVAIAVTACGGSTFTEADRTAVLAVEDTYRAAWQANDADGVMATLTEDVTLFPPNRGPLRGDAEIRAFWWPPDAAPVTITRYEATVDHVEGGGDLAFVRGTAELVFQWEQDGRQMTQENRSWSLTVLRREDDGAWRIVTRAWGSLDG